jgi:hypothetical protein
MIKMIRIGKDGRTVETVRINGIKITTTVEENGTVTERKKHPSGAKDIRIINKKLGFVLSHYF